MVTMEQDLRLGILNTLLTTPHRDLESIWQVHSGLITKDPRFYVRLGAWYSESGDVRDHKEMFIINLVLSDSSGHREVGLAMLRELPPYQVIRVVNFISGVKKTRKIRKGEKAKALAQASRKGRRDVARQVLGTTAKASTKSKAKPSDAETITEQFGLFRNVPRAMKTEITRYLREREADDDWFDGSVLAARKAMKRLYALLHIKPGDRAQQILFDDQPPPDSRLYALRVLAQAKSPAEQAEAIVQHRIPYRIASTVIHQMTPTVLLALVDQMSPQELINNLGMLKRRGAMNVPEIKELVEAKLGDAKNASRVSAFKAKKAIEATGVDGALRDQLDEVADAQVKAKGRIKRPTALLIDKSSSMEQAIELGKRIGAMISAVCESELYTFAFDTVPYPIVPEGQSLADWERAMEGITAGGCTSCGVAIKALTMKEIYVEQIIMITDEEENTPPPFVTALREYRETMKCDPSLFIVRTPGGSSYLEKLCGREKIPIDIFQFSGDYYSLPNLIPMLSRPTKLELLMEIMDFPLPARKSA